MTKSVFNHIDDGRAHKSRIRRDMVMHRPRHHMLRRRSRRCWRNAIRRSYQLRAAQSQWITVRDGKSKTSDLSRRIWTLTKMYSQPKNLRITILAPINLVTTCNGLQRLQTHCNVLQCSHKTCNRCQSRLQWIQRHYKPLQCITMSYNRLQLSLPKTPKSKLMISVELLQT